MIGDIRAVPLATDIAGEQTLNIGKTDEIAESIMPSPGSEIPFVTSAHDDTRSGSRPNPRLRFYLSLRNLAPRIQNAEGHSDFSTAVKPIQGVPPSGPSFSAEGHPSANWRGFRRAMMNTPKVPPRHRSQAACAWQAGLLVARAYPPGGRSKAREP